MMGRPGDTTAPRPTSDATRLYIAIISRQSVLHELQVTFLKAQMSDSTCEIGDRESVDPGFGVSRESYKPHPLVLERVNGNGLERVQGRATAVVGRFLTSPGAQNELGVLD